MAYAFELKPNLERELKKIGKKDRATFKAVRNKIEEIIKDPHHYKPLRYDLKGLRRAHIEKSFVLVFEIDEQEKTVRFLNLAHHDEVYKRRY